MSDKNRECSHDSAVEREKGQTTETFLVKIEVRGRPHANLGFLVDSRSEHVVHKGKTATNVQPITAAY